MTTEKGKAAPVATDAALKTDVAAKFDYSDLPAKISNVIKDMPDLSSYGFRFRQRSGEAWNDGENFDRFRAEMASADFAWQVQTAAECILTDHPRGYGLHIARSGSYTLKHAVEGWVRRSGRSDLSRYVSNGAFIVAAYLVGWKIVRYPNCPNCTFRRGGK